MKKRRLLILSVLVIALLVGGCGLWVWQAKRQYALNRQLIAALLGGDTKQAIALVNAGADPNTRLSPSPVPSLLQLVKQRLHHSLPISNNTPTALMIACGANREDEAPIAQNIADTPHLMQTMLLHGAEVNAKSGHGTTALLWAMFTHQNKDIIKQLLAYGADPNMPVSLDVEGMIIGGQSAIEWAKTLDRPDIVALLRKGAK